MSEFNLEEKTKEVKKYFEAKEDLKKLNKLYMQILDLNFNDKNLDIIKDELTSKINKEITEKMVKENISTKEGKAILEEVKEEFEADESLFKLANNEIDCMLEICDNFDIVDNLLCFEFNKNFIINCFSDEYEQLEASRNYSLITDEPFLYENKEYHLYVTKDDLSFVYGEKIDNLSEPELEDLAENLAKVYIQDEENYDYGITFSEFITDYTPELEKDDEEEE